MGEYQRENSPDRFLFSRGEFFPDKMGTPRFKFDAPSHALITYDILPNSTMIPLVSPTVANWLEENCTKDVQMIPTEVSTADRALLNYKLVNVLHLVSGVDESQSKCVYFPGTKNIMKFNRLRLKEDCFKNHHLARLAEYPSFILVTAFVKHKFESSGWKDHRFVPPEAVHP